MGAPIAPGSAALAIAVTCVLASCSRQDADGAQPSDPAAAPVADTKTGDAHPTRRALPSVVFEPDGGAPAEVTVEIADTPAAIQRGLMYREHLPPDHGMLFIFRDEQIRTFWMKNTLIPLDMIFISSDRLVAGIVENAEPRTTTPRRVDAPSQYVVEVNGGWARARGVEVGTPVRFVDVD